MIHLLIGEESLLVERALKKLLKELVPASARDFNFDVLEGPQLEAKRFWEIALTLPVFAPHRLILIPNAQEIEKGEGEILEPLLPGIPETTHVIFVADSVDRRLAFWKKLLESGRVQQFKPLFPREIPSWILREAQSSGYQVSSEAAQWMATVLGSDLSLILSALEKLYLLSGGKKYLNLSDAESCIQGLSWKSVFDLTEAVGRRDLPRALLLFKGMFLEGESPIALLGLLARHFRILMKVKEGEREGISPYFFKDYERQAQEYTGALLREKMEGIFQTDRILKNSSIPAVIAFERLLMDLCRY